MSAGTVHDRSTRLPRNSQSRPGSCAMNRTDGLVDNVVSWRRFCVVPRSKEVLLEEIRRLYSALRSEVDLGGLSLVEIGLVDRRGILEVRFYFRLVS